MTLVTLGHGPSVAHAQDDPAALLEACHVRIRRFCSLARELARGEAPPSAIAEAAWLIHRYFTVALPLHVADEEESVEARLLAPGASLEIRRTFAAMEVEHHVIERVLERLTPMWNKLVADPACHETIAKQLRHDTECLTEVFAAHLAEEERTVFPALRRLSIAEQHRIADEIHARRG
jgi:iron-sulfur cluster repair protein YtfE (RIC family)